MEWPWEIHGPAQIQIKSCPLFAFFKNDDDWITEQRAEVVVTETADDVRMKGSRWDTKASLGFVDAEQVFSLRSSWRLSTLIHVHPVEYYIDGEVHQKYFQRWATTAVLSALWWQQHKVRNSISITRNVVPVIRFSLWVIFLFVSLPRSCN